jgi:hypothetical protein
MKNLKHLLASALLLAGLGANAQGPTLEWANAAGGPSSDIGFDIETDAAGNVYTGGRFFGTADLDPGPGVSNVTAVGLWDNCLQKLDANGNFLWGVSSGGSDNDEIHAIAVDAAGNVYSTGLFRNTVDFDPGPGVFNITGNGFFIQKLDPNGNFLWAKGFSTGTSGDARGINIDASGNVYVAGHFKVNTDFDPGPGSFVVPVVGNINSFILKLDAAGDFVWVRTMGGTNQNLIHGMDMDNSGNIYVAGGFDGTVDFDPGTGVDNHTTTGILNGFVMKLDAFGDHVWARSFVGANFNITYGVTADNSGNVYSAGWYQATTDFDPGPGVHNLTPLSFRNAYVHKLDASGNFQWVAPIENTTDIVEANAVELDAAGNVYCAGTFKGTADFDPGAGTNNLTSGITQDGFVQKLTPAGTLDWVAHHGGAGYVIGRGIWLDAADNIYTTGQLYGIADFDPEASVVNVSNPGGQDDMYVCKMTPPTGCSANYTIGDVTPTCSNPTFCVPVEATTPISSGLFGIDFELNYDPLIMTPTGNATLGPVATSYGAYFMVDDPVAGKVTTTVYLSGAPLGTYLNGAGDIICIEFTVNAGVASGTTFNFTTNGIIEGIPGSPTCNETAGLFTFADDNLLNGYLHFIDKQGREISYDPLNPTDYLITTITGVDAACGNPSVAVTPDLNGDFTYDLTNGSNMMIERDIVGDFGVPLASCTDVMPVINGTDANRVLDIITGVITPDIYELLAADVNLDGLVNSMDVSLVTSRTLNLNNCEYIQSNYYWDGTAYVPVGGYVPSKDWLFMDETTLTTDPSYTGADRFTVPTVPSCIPVSSTGGPCSSIPAEDINGVLLGDVNGNWNTADGTAGRSGEKVVFDLSAATMINANTYKFPVHYVGSDPIVSIDFAMDYEELEMQVIDVEKEAGLSAYNMLFKDHSIGELRLTSYGTNNLNSTDAVFQMTVQDLLNSYLLPSQFGTITAYINGVPVNVEIIPGLLTSVNDVNELGLVEIAPNPSTGIFNISIENATSNISLNIVNSLGQQVLAKEMAAAGNFTGQFDLTTVPAGLYFVTVSTDVASKVVRIVKQ